MNGPFVVAQAPTTGLGVAQDAQKKPLRIVKVTKPLDGQAITIDLGYEQQTKLDLAGVANEKMTLVHIGEKLIILFDNNATVTIEPFFNSMGVPRFDLTVEVASGRELTGIQFANLFPITTDPSVLPAAGEATRPASGANFSDPSVDLLLSPDPLPLLPPEELPNWQVHFETVPLQEVVLPLVEDEPPPPNGLPSIGVNAAVRMDDEDLTNGILGSVDGSDDPGPTPFNAKGVLSYDFGSDGRGTVLLLGTGAPVGFAYVLNAAGTQLTILQNGNPNPVLQVTLTNATGGYEVTQLEPIVHPPGFGENDVAFSINYRVTDANGDFIDGVLSINVDDDGPTVTANAIDDSIVLTTQDAETDGDPTTEDTASASIPAAFLAAAVPVYGADGPGTTVISGYALNLVGASGADSGLDNNGVQINLYNVGGVIVGSTALVAPATATDASVVFSIAVDSAGLVTLTQYAEIDHQPEDVDATNDNFNIGLATGLVTLTATATVTDGDNDTTTTTVSADLGGNISFIDDGPTAVADNAGTIPEDAPFNYNVLTNDVSGADTPATLVAATLATPGAGSVTGFLPNGTISFDPAPGFAGAVTINYTIQDADGDQSSSTLTLTVAADSTPTVSVTDGTVDEKGLVDGSGELADPALNSDTSETTTGTFTITTGGDTLASLVVGGVDVTAGGVVNGTYGVLTVTNTAGNYTWSYTLSDNTLAHTDTVVDAELRPWCGRPGVRQFQRRCDGFGRRPCHPRHPQHRHQRRRPDRGCGQCRDDPGRRAVQLQRSDQRRVWCGYAGDAGCGHAGDPRRWQRHRLPAQRHHQL